MRCVFTGPRTQSLDNGLANPSQLECPFYYAIAKAIKEVLIAHINRLESEGKGEKLVLITGMADGIDTVAGLLAIKLKERYPDHAALHAYIPFKDHKPKTPYRKKKYEMILQAADLVYYVCDEPYEKEGKGRPWLLTNRNHAMVDTLVDPSDFVFGVFHETGKKGGGTRECLTYAKKKGKTCLILNPYTLEMKRGHL